MKRQEVAVLVSKFGQKYSELLGINVAGKADAEIFKWFLASLLFGAPITEKAAVKTYQCFEKHGVLSPAAILKTGWDELVRILDEGSYTRYDFKTADKLLEVAKNLAKEYGESLNLLHQKASDSVDLEKRIKSLGKGIGDTTVSIFLRDLRGIWKKADSNPTHLAVFAAEKTGIIGKDSALPVLAQLKRFWSKNAVEGQSFVNFETALLRLGKDFCRKEKCLACPVRQSCLSRKAL